MYIYIYIYIYIYLYVYIYIYVIYGSSYFVPAVLILYTPPRCNKKTNSWSGPQFTLNLKKIGMKPGSEINFLLVFSKFYTKII